MKQVNFSHSGGFPLEQETLERLQTAYRSELFEALKSHLSINTDKDYIVAPATNEKQGWAIIHPKDNTGAKTLEGILYPILKGTPTGFLKTTRTGTNLVYGTGVSQTAYFDYEAIYISQANYESRPTSPQITDALAVHYYDLKDFKVVKDIESYLPIDGSKAMQGDLDLGSYKLSKLDTKEALAANVRAIDFRLGSASKRGLTHSDPLGRALADSSTLSATSLSLNYGSDWDNTNIGGKVYLDNIKSAGSVGSLLVLDNSNQVVKSNTLIESLIKRITDLEEKPATTVPIGMIAIWGKPAPFPEGWEEYVPLIGRMPVGLDLADPDFKTLGATGGNKDKKLIIDELPIVSPINGSGIKKGGKWGGTNGLTLGDSADGDYAPGQFIKPFGGDKPFSILNPYRVVHFIEYTGKSSDTIKPISPTNLTASNIGTTSLTLNWTASTDDVGVTNYLIYKDNVLLKTIGNILSYSVIGLSKGISYNFSVIAKDAAGNLSIPATVIATTIATDLTAPTVPAYFSCFTTGQGNIGLQWGTSIDDDSPITYELSRKIDNGSFIVFKTTTDTYHYELGSPGTTYSYKVRAIDPSGNASDYKEATITLSSTGGSCFDIESLVTMASGQSKKLKNVMVGDKLQGFSFPNEIDESKGDYMLWSGKLAEASKAEVIVVNKRTNIQPNYYEIKTEDTLIKVTGEHPLLITEDGENVKWVCTKNVLENMCLIDKTGKSQSIESILFKEEPLEVALLDVESVDNYIISGIVAHNKEIEQMPE
jgi:chitodextrinase